MATKRSIKKPEVVKPSASTSFDSANPALVQRFGRALYRFAMP